MVKKRVHEIAKDLGYQNRDLIDKLQKLGFEVKSHSSTVDEAEVRRAIKKADDERRARTEEKRLSGGVIRRRSREKVIRRRSGSKVEEPAAEAPVAEVQAAIERSWETERWEEIQSIRGV